MARLIDRSFDPNRPVKARRFFVAAGRHWEPGRAFPWKNMALAQRRVKLLFDAGKLMHADYADGGVVGAEDFTPALMGEKPSESTITPAPTVSQEVQVQDEDAFHIAVTATPAEPMDDLDGLNMKELREIADREGAPSRVSREAQREAIREQRRAAAEDQT